MFNLHNLPFDSTTYPVNKRTKSKEAFFSERRLK